MHFHLIRQKHLLQEPFGGVGDADALRAESRGDQARGHERLNFQRWK